MLKKELSTNQKLMLNLIASFIAFAVTFGINFFLSPYIVRTVGVEAYGFVNLANNFISYASLITIAVNALSGRFISVKIYKNDYEGANKYYTSVFFANSFLSLILLILATVVWIFLEYIIEIPEAIFWDVKLLFAMLFANCVINTLSSVFSVSTFATNKLYLTSIISIESGVARAIVLVLLFTFCAPKVSYLGITSLMVGVYCAVYYYYYIRKLTPYLHIKKKYFDFKAIVELVSSGVWNLINRLGQILTDGLDLLITNIFIDATSMGILSVAKTVPSAITSIVGSMVGSFSPNFTQLYAEQKMDELKKAVKQSMKIMGVICNLPIIVLIVCGEKFFPLWQPTQDPKQLQILSLLTVACIIFSGGINCLYNIFTVVNKLKLNSLVVVGCGFLNTIIVYILIKTTSLGIYAVAGVSTIISIIRNLAFTAPYGAKCINLKWYAFYPDIFRPVIFVVISAIPSYFITHLITGHGWISLIICASITVIISVLLGYFIVFNKEDRAYVNGIITKHLKREHQ